MCGSLYPVMSYDRWPPTPEPQRLYDPPEDHVDGGAGYPRQERGAVPGGQPPDAARSDAWPRQPYSEYGGGPQAYHERPPYGGGPRGPRPPGGLRPTGDGPRAQRRAARRRAQQRRRRSLAALILLALVGTIGYLVLRDNGGSGPQTQADVQQSATAAATKPVVAPQPTQVQPAVAVEPGNVPQTGPGTFAYATGTGKTLGSAGTLRRFQVAVEKDVKQNANAFAATVDRILGDPRSWIAAGKSRFQRVPSGVTHEFVIYLATPATSEKMCAAGGLHTDKYTSCRLPGQVIINLERWLTGVPNYGASLDVYQQYAINHEVGHQLGLYHEACPARGQTAPVMQQQTLGLKGCVANGWPYVGGVRVTGPPIP
jgi:hypothetical protein